jgi:hypothetical protein
MRAILALFIVLAVAFVLVGTSAAAPGGDVKASPLFKRSLEESIAKLEGKASEGISPREAEPTPTGRPGCPQPDLPETESSTCYPSLCGGNTCGGGTCQGEVTCYNTCGTTCSGSTCTSTCANTCSGPTCGSTCENTCEQVCPWVKGDVAFDGNYNYDWSSSGWALRKVTLFNLSGQEVRSTQFYLNGYYEMESIYSQGYLKAEARWAFATYCRRYYGTESKPVQGNGVIWRYIDIKSSQYIDTPNCVD